MRYEPDHKEKTRRNILDSGARLFRRNGYSGTSVKDVMAAADLTVGGFYAHFTNKNELYRESFRHAVIESNLLINKAIQTSKTKDWLRGWMETYFGDEHVRMKANGCPLPSMSVDIDRGDETAKAVYAECIELRLQEALSHFPKHQHRKLRPILCQLITLGVGMLTLARSLPEGPLRDEVLTSARQQAEHVVARL